MTHKVFSTVIGVPMATVRTWEQSRTNMDRAFRSSLRVFKRELDAALHALEE